MQAERCEIAIDGSAVLTLHLRAFGAPLPSAAGIYVLFLPPRDADEAARGHGAILHLGQSDDLDETIGRGHGGHGRFWTFVAAGVSAVGFVLMADGGERRALLRAIAGWHRVPLPDLPG